MHWFIFAFFHSADPSKKVRCFFFFFLFLSDIPAPNEINMTRERKAKAVIRFVLESQSFRKTSFFSSPPPNDKKQQRQQKDEMETLTRKDEMNKRTNICFSQRLTANLRAMWLSFKQCGGRDLKEGMYSITLILCISITQRGLVVVSPGGLAYSKAIKMKRQCNVWALGVSFFLVRNMCISRHITLIPPQTEDDTLLSPLWIIISRWQQQTRKIICKSDLNGCHYCIFIITSATSASPWGGHQLQ